MSDIDECDVCGHTLIWDSIEEDFICPRCYGDDTIDDVDQDDSE